MTRYRFDKIAENINIRVLPADTALDRYVELEHLDPESLKIRRWGSPADVMGQKCAYRRYARDGRAPCGRYRQNRASCAFPRLAEPQRWRARGQESAAADVIQVQVAPEYRAVHESVWVYQAVLLSRTR